MAIYKTGGFTTTLGGAAQNLTLGFIPSYFRAENHTNLVTAANGEVVAFEWYNTMPNATAYLTTYAAAATTSILMKYQATVGVTPFQTADSSLYTSTNLTITGITGGATTSITATHNFTSDDIGVTTVTISGVKGMTQINTLRGVIQTVTSTTSFTVNINSSSFTAYSSGGIANVITGRPAKTLYSSNTPIITDANWIQPVVGGDGQFLNTAQANVGVIGLTLGTALMTTTDDLWRYTAVLDAPFTS